VICNSREHFAEAAIAGIPVLASYSSCVRLRVVVGSKDFEIVESEVVNCERSQESFDLALSCGFSNGSHDVLDSIGFAEVCELAWAVGAVELRAMVV